MSIKSVDFGRIDAEAEQNLGGYFVDTGVLAKLTNGSKYLVIGRKGSGKTALFKLTTKEKLWRDVSLARRRSGRGARSSAESTRAAREHERSNRGVNGSRRARNAREIAEAPRRT
jgi:ATPase subunit of ABC transporter with duplicated ATPase domains